MDYKKLADISEKMVFGSEEEPKEKFKSLDKTTLLKVYFYLKQAELELLNARSSDFDLGTEVIAVRDTAESMLESLGVSSQEINYFLETYKPK